MTISLTPTISCIHHFSVDLSYVLYKGVAIVDVEEKFPPSWGIPVCIACGAFCGLLWIFIFGPCAKTVSYTSDAADDLLCVDLDPMCFG